MRKQLDGEIMKSRDVMFLPEYEIGLISKTTTPYEYRLDNKNYPIKEIYAAASLSGKRGEDVARRQIGLLYSKNKIVRYWAMIGLRAQDQETLEPYQKVLTQSMQDSYPPVSVTAAAIAYQAFNDEKAEDILKKFCQDDNMDLALMAINYLLYINNEQKAPFVQTIKAVHDMEHRNYNVKAACMDFLGSLGLVPNDFAHKD